MPDLRDSIRSHLTRLVDQPLAEAARDLLAAIGYKSDRKVAPGSVDDFCRKFDREGVLQHPAALKTDWKSIHLLFQLTDAELAGHATLFNETEVQPGLHRAYLFFAVELTGQDYARGKLTGIARRLNRLFPMPVMVLIKHRDAQQQAVLSIAVINRRRNKVHTERDVLEKATIIRDISLAEPHRGHLDIIASLAVPNLEHPDRLPINNFETLHAAWEQILNVELLNKRFYRELANWYFWAMKHCHFPLLDEKADKYFLFKDRTQVREHEAKNLIRLLTRLLFVWFIKQRGLVPNALFNAADLKNSLLNNFDPESTGTHYYKSVLQNLFFASLNQTQGQREFRKSGQHQNTTTLLRYEDSLRDPKEFVALLEKHTPFLNGGLFECLDHPHPTKKGPQGGAVIIYEDGFSDRKDNPLHMPDFLFFGKGNDCEDLSGDHAYGEKKFSREKVRGLIHILEAYKFTVVENTPIDQEIALDPELLGQVFENLLASYNPETKTTARKQTGSFYTPRPIVDYMVDESLKAHLTQSLTQGGASSVSTASASPASTMTEADAKEGLDILFAYTEKEHAFTPSEVATLIRSIDTCKILDPACGSGAFPMGALQKLVYILSKLDPDNDRWKQTQLDKLDSAPMRESLERDFEDNDDDYGRKLYLIENCLYGVDIQSIATQVSKLRFFISLIVDQSVDRTKENFGVRPLPNLETKFVTADTLISIERPNTQTELFETTEVTELQLQLKRVRHALFSAKTPRTKNKHREDDKRLREAIATELQNNGWPNTSARDLADWDPYNQNASAGYFDPEWMFGEKAFDIVIGNPPYIQIQKFPKAKKARWVSQGFQTYAAMGDIYALFYERAAQLLRDGGHLSYITSNKWMRAGYGERLRTFLSTAVDTTALLDFGMAQNFSAATTYTCITAFTKTPTLNHMLSCYATNTASAMSDPGEYLRNNAVPLSVVEGDPWVVISPERHSVKQRVETQGLPLGDWDIRINYGIKTGFNDAFYVTQEQRDVFAGEKEGSRCEKFLVPLLRGRHIDRYTTDWDGTWMISTFPARQLSESQIPDCLIRHLEKFRRSLEPRPAGWSGSGWSGRKAGPYEWFEVQDVISYHEEFSKPKVIYPEITKYIPAYFDRAGYYYPNNKGFILNSETESLAYLTAFLNSHLFRCCYRDNFPELMGNTYEVRKIFVEKIPVKKPTDIQEKLFESLVSLVQHAKKVGALSAANFLEDLIDACVMECYFRDHMAERDLLFHDKIMERLIGYDPDASEEDQSEFHTLFHITLNSPKHPVRNQLLRLTADSPDLLAVIKREGAV